MSRARAALMQLSISAPASRPQRRGRTLLRPGLQPTGTCHPCLGLRAVAQGQELEETTGWFLALISPALVPHT